EGTLDVVLANIPAGPMPEGLVHEVLFNTRSFVLAGENHPIAKAASTLSLPEISAAQWALVSEAKGPDVLSYLQQADGFDLSRPALETNSLSLVRTMLLSGQFLSILAEHWLKDDLEAGRIVRLPVETMPLIRPAGVMMRKEPSRAASVALFVDKARAHAAGWSSSSV
ncbi:MAG: substrate-binding domain-containing protein, partial [Pseudomonadota bacterium]